MKNIITPEFPGDLIRYLAVAEAARREAEMDRLRNGVRQLPVSEATLVRLAELPSDEFAKIMMRHAGFSLEKSRSSLWAMLDTFRQGWGDLQASFAKFCDFSADFLIPFSAREQMRGEILQLIRRDLLVLSTTAAALVAMARRVNSELRHPEFDSQKERIFDSSQHRFITDLRNNLAHICSLPTQWTVRYRKYQQPEIMIEFHPKKLLAEGEFKQESRSYLENVGNAINIIDLFRDYAARVEHFYAWLRQQIELDEKLADYRKCEVRNRASRERNSWRLVIGASLQAHLDPYLHLARAFRPEELEEINKLPKNSKEQVDRMIELADTCKVFDEDLRSMAYKLFRVET